MTVPLWSRRHHATTEPPPPDPATWPTGHRFDVELVQRDGFQAIGQLLTAEVDEVTERLNDVDGMTGQWSTFDRTLFTHGTGALQLLVQASLDGEPIMRCPIFDDDIDETGQLKPSLHSEKIWWEKRMFGRANRPNQYTYSSFDPDDPGHRWQAANCAPTIVTDPALVDGGLTLQVPAPVDWGAGAYAENLTWAVPHQFTPGISYVVVHYLRQDIARTFVGSVLELRRYASLAEAEAGHALDTQTITLDQIDDPVEGWHRVALGIWIPPGPASLLGTRLMAPKTGTAQWGGGDPADESKGGYRMNRDEAFATLETGQQASTVFARQVDYMQDPAKGKSDLGIGSYCVPAGKTVVISEPEHLHRTMADFRDEQLVNIDGGIDWGIRYLRSGELAYTGTPRLGQHLDDMPLTLDRWLAIRIAERGGGTVTDVIELGDHNEFFGEEGTASDRTGTGGTVIDGTHQAPKGTPWPHLDATARRRLELVKDLVVTIEADLTMEKWWWIQCGDTVDADHQIGQVALTGQYRVQAKTLKPKDGIVTVELAPLDYGKDLADDVTGDRRRLGQLERATDPASRRKFGSAPFSLGGSLVAAGAVQWGTFPYPNPGSVGRVEVRARVAVDVDVPIVVTVDGAATTVMFPAGSTSLEQPITPMPHGAPGALSIAADFTGASTGSDFAVNLIVREQDI